MKDLVRQETAESLRVKSVATFFQVLQKGQSDRQEKLLNQEQKEQLICFAKSVKRSRIRRFKAAYFLFSILFLAVSFSLSMRKIQYMSKPLDWIGLLFMWERQYGPFFSFMAPITLFLYTFFFPLSFRDTYRRYLLSYFLVMFAQAIALLFSFANFGLARICIEIVLYGIYVPITLWAWSDLKVELEMAYILDKRYSFIFTFWRILETCCCFIMSLFRLLVIPLFYSTELLPTWKASWMNATKYMFGLSNLSIHNWKNLLVIRVGYLLLYCYTLYSLLFFTLFVDCGSEFYSRNDISPFTKLFFCLGLLDRDLTKRESRKKKAAWKGFFAAIDRKLKGIVDPEKHSVNIGGVASYPLENQSDVFSYIASFEVPWDEELELREEVLLPFRDYLNNVALAIKARQEAYPKTEEKMLLPGSTRELEEALLLFSEAIPPNREHYDVERLYDEPEGNISLNSDTREHSESKEA